MLQEVNGCIQEFPSTATTAVLTTTNTGYVPSSTVEYASSCWWGNYPVYVCLDKTKKAIDILKALEADKTLKVTSVPRFIALVEKISGLL
jgi:hypothetical protein